MSKTFDGAIRKIALGSVVAGIIALGVGADSNSGAFAVATPAYAVSAVSATLVEEQAQPRPQPPRQPSSRPDERQPKPDAREPNRIPSTRDARLTFRESVNRLQAQSPVEYRRLTLRADKLLRRIEKADLKKKSSKKARAALKRQFNLAYVTRGGRQVLVRDQELLAVNLSKNSRTNLENLGFKVMRSSKLGRVGLRLDLLLVPKGMSTEEALSTVKTVDKKGYYNYNLAYKPAASTALPAGAEITTARVASSALALDETASVKTSGQGTPGSEPLIVGMVDTGINKKHKSLVGADVVQINMGRGKEITPRDHGTAVASILAKGTPAQIMLVDVFSGPAAYADAESIVIALEILARQNVAVINMSIAGPKNDLLEMAVKNLIDRGHIIVAAVGNAGPEGPDQFPAAHSGVVGVTAVDRDHVIFKEANQGVAVDYAAFGVKVKAASLTGRKNYSGTSFAAPIVSAFLANQLTRPDAARVAKAMLMLDAATKDLGLEGRDPVFGRGYLPAK
ncbi:MAG: hypothetical protein COB37_02915 [Kordiimonadales bacterium]|nr:MAG: hypothetical protein COB37_02915 [Kordiimonadales bacterium]